MDVTIDLLRHFSRAITIPTVSAQKYSDTNFEPFDEFKVFLRESFPLFHKTCSLIEVNNYGLVYRWTGTESGKNSSLAPFLFCAHYDVVPVETGTEATWKYPPFSGKIAEGRVWGRGAFDIKCQITAQLEAVEALISGGFTPKRDFYFAYGHDEETGGREGAAKIAAWFSEQGIHFEGVLDEGGAITSDAIKGMRRPIAMIGITEKGRADYEVTVDGEGGHSSTPPPHSALGIAALLMSRVERHPLPVRLTSTVRVMLKLMRRSFGAGFGFIAGNLWLFKPLLLSAFAKNPVTAAFVRTTFAVTQAHGSEAPNVLPQKARFVIDVRLLHGDTIQKTLNYFNKLFRGQAKIECIYGEEPSAISPVGSDVFRRLTDTIAALFPDAVSVPYLVCGGTDARKYYHVSKNVYRFTPAVITQQDKKAMHGTNESLSIENYARMIQFYTMFIKDYNR